MSNIESYIHTSSNDAVTLHLHHNHADLPLEESQLQVIVGANSLRSAAIVSDQVIWSNGLRSLMLEAFPHLHCEVLSRQQARKTNLGVNSQLYILNVSHPDDFDVELISYLRKIPTLLLCHQYCCTRAASFIRCGALGLLDESCTVQELRDAMLHVSKGNLFVDNKFHWSILREFLQPQGTVVKKCKLSKGQITVAKCIARGLSNHQVAEETGMTQGTVATYVTRLRVALGVVNRNAMIAYINANPQIFDEHV